MMTPADMRRMADLCYYQGDPEGGKQWHMLARFVEERYPAVKPDPDQQDYDEYIEEMSLGGRRYRP